MCLAVPGRVAKSLGETDGVAFAEVDFGGVARAVCTACVPDAVPGDYVLVHAGVAIGMLDADEADRLLAELRALGENGETDVP